MYAGLQQKMKRKKKKKKKKKHPPMMKGKWEKRKYNNFILVRENLFAE